MYVSSRWCVTAVFALGALSCSDPVPPPAQGAFIASVRPTSPPPDGKSCPTSAVTFDVPAFIDAAPTEQLDQDTYLHHIVDGEDGSSARCSVKGSSSFTFAGTLRGGARSLDISNGTLGADKKGTASITVIDTSRSIQLSSPGPTCTIDASPGASNRFEVKGGSMWASFTCPAIERPPTDSCMSTGYFVLEHCEE
jgi:hypothetical protein